jgi:hypothetical protein
MSMEEFGDVFFVVRDVRQKAFELLKHRAKHTQKRLGGAVGLKCRANTLG